MKTWHLALLGGVGILSFATGASAQQESGTSQATGSDQAPDDAAGTIKASSTADVIVTGSRLVQNGFQAPTPVTVLSAASLEEHAAQSIPEALRELPALIKSTSSRAVPNIASGDPNAGSGTYLNLRNLGNQRMLLLQDGMRVPPTRSNGLTDANVIPQLLVSRVEVVTGGASAAYGSDAVSGVINYIMDNHFTGIRGLAQTSISERGDDAGYRGGLAVGKSLLNDRLHLVASAEYRQDYGINSFCKRPIACENYAIGGVNGVATLPGTASNPFVPYKGVYNIGLSPGGYISRVFNANGTTNTAGQAILARNRIVFQPGGAVLAPYAAGTQVNTSLCIQCDGGTLSVSEDFLINPAETMQFYGHADFDLTPEVTVWAQGSYGRSHTRQNLTDEYFFGAAGNTLTIYSGNPFLSRSVQSVLDTTGSVSFQLDAQRSSAGGDLEQLDYDGVAKNRMFNVGIKGTIADNYKWKVYGQHSRSSLRSSGNQSESARLYAAVDAVSDPSGTIVCRVMLTNPGLYPGCVPLNLFGTGSPSQAAKDYIRGHYVSQQTTTLKSAGADIAGSPFSNWAGAVAVALGVEYRKQSLVVTSNTNDPVPAAGVRFGTASQLRFRNTNTQPTTGSYTVREGFGEVDVPLLRDVGIGGLTVARRLSVNGAVRFTDYSTSGEVTSWKVGGSWQVNDDLRLRVTRSRDVRAPTLDDLFGPKTQTTALLNDIHTNVNSAIATTTQGNLALRPERANTWTVGGVFNPSYLRGFSTSIDWYRIGVTDAIQSFGGVQLISACEASNGASDLCRGVVRPLPFSDRSPANFPTQILAQSFNANQLIVKGIDFEASYRTALLGGQTRLRLLTTYQYEYRSQASPVNPLIDSAGYQTNPKLVMSGSIGYDKDGFGIDVQTRRIGKWNQNSPPGTVGAIQVFRDPIVKPVYYTDLALSYAFKTSAERMLELYMNVDNLFDKQPPFIPIAVPALAYPTTRTLYDIVGREFAVGVRFRY